MSKQKEVKQFSVDCDYTHRMFVAFGEKTYKQVGHSIALWIVTRKIQMEKAEFIEVANLMHDQIGDAYISGMGCRAAAWKSFIQALEARFELCVQDAQKLASSIFRSIDIIAAYT